MRQGVPLEEILTMLPWILSRRRWERKANPGAEDQKRSRKKKKRKGAGEREGCIW